MEFTIINNLLIPMSKTKAGKKIVEARAHFRRTKKGKKIKVREYRRSTPDHCCKK